MFPIEPEQIIGGNHVEEELLGLALEINIGIFTSTSSTVAPVLQKQLEGLMRWCHKRKHGTFLVSKIFGSGNFDIQNQPRGLSETKENEELKAIVEADPSQSTSEIAAGFGVNDKTVLIRLKQIGNVKKT